VILRSARAGGCRVLYCCTAPGFGDTDPYPNDTRMNPPDSTILIVTGAHLAAEVAHRPLAYWLRQRVVEHEAGLGTAAAARPPEVIVCSDLWYLNQDGLRALPTVSIGEPDVNALSAYLASRLPSVLAVEGAWVVLMDAGDQVPQACCWGRDAEATHAAVQAFTERHLPAFLGEA
jgi:hypothetical protein